MYQNVLRATLVSFGLMLTACVKDVYDEALVSVVAGDCEEAQKHLQSGWVESDMVQLSGKAATTSASYGVTAAGYLADATFYVSKGILVFAVACAPAFILRSGQCLPFPDPDVDSPQLGKKSYEKTASWRFSDADKKADALMGIARCFRKRGGVSNLKISLAHLQQAKRSEIYDGLSFSKKSVISSLLLELEGDVAASNP